MGVLVGADAMKADAQRLDAAAKHLRHGEDGIVAPAAHLEGERDQRIDVAKRAKGGENNPHAGEVEVSTMTVADGGDWGKWVG